MNNSKTFSMLIIALQLISFGCESARPLMPAGDNPKHWTQRKNISVKHVYSALLGGLDSDATPTEWPVENFAFSVKHNTLVYGTVKESFSDKNDELENKPFRIYFFPLNSEDLAIDQIGDADIVWKEKVQPRLAIQSPKTACLLGSQHVYLLRPFKRPEIISIDSSRAKGCVNDQALFKPKPFIGETEGGIGELKDFYEKVKPPGMKVGTPYTLGHYVFSQKFAILFRMALSDRETGGLWEAHLIDREKRQDLGMASFPGVFPGAPLAQGDDWVIFGTQPIYMTDFGGQIVMLQIK